MTNEQLSCSGLLLVSQKDVEKSARQLNNSYFTLVLILQALVNIYCGEKKNTFVF